MAIVRPFKGIRPNPVEVAKIAALPYDVYNREEARNEVSDKPLSFLKIDRAETFFDASEDMYSEKIYQKAHDHLYQMISEGHFVQDGEACYYIYQLTMQGRAQTGLVACTSIDEYLNNQIKKHELTRESKEIDRIKHVDYCDANTGPIFLTYKGVTLIDVICQAWMKEHEHVYDFTSEDDIRHEVWKLDEPIIMETLKKAYGDVPALYIADGHHRAASAVKVGLKRRQEFPNYTGEEEFNFFLSVLFPDHQLKIMDYNRVVKDLNGLSAAQFLTSLNKKFNILALQDEMIQPTQKATFGMFLEEKWYLLEAKEGTYPTNNPVAQLDVSILQDNLLAPILGIGDPRVDERIDFVGGIRGLKELERRVRTDMTVAFAMVPTSILELMEIADADELMPPKSTWFEPKLRSGLFVHLLK